MSANPRNANGHRRRQLRGGLLLEYGDTLHEIRVANRIPKSRV